MQEDVMIVIPCLWADSGECRDAHNALVCCLCRSLFSQPKHLWYCLPYCLRLCASPTVALHCLPVSRLACPPLWIPTGEIQNDGPKLTENWKILAFDQMGAMWIASLPPRHERWQANTRWSWHTCLTDADFLQRSLMSRPSIGIGNFNEQNLDRYHEEKGEQGAKRWLHVDVFFRPVSIYAVSFWQLYERAVWHVKKGQHVSLSSSIPLSLSLPLSLSECRMMWHTPRHQSLSLAIPLPLYNNICKADPLEFQI